MGILIVGGGISGLVTAIKMKDKDKEADVTLLEKNRPTANSQISGLRFRQNDILSLLVSRNGGVLTEEMSIFARIAEEELELWKGVLPYEQEDSWFGPQFLSGRGNSMIMSLRDLAHQKGIKFLEGEAVKLIKEGKSVAGVEAVLGNSKEISEIGAGLTVLANGGAVGNLFISTNREIRNSAHELAFQAGLSLVDTTINMFHPFGRCDRDGHPQLGCFETDRLAGANIIFPDGKTAESVIELLKNHDAHNHFPEISKLFLKHGGMVKIIFPDGKEGNARVSLHYSHMGIETEDGVKVKGANSLLAVGEAANIGHWTSHRERFPGFALLNCMVTGAIAAEHASGITRNDRIRPVEIRAELGKRIEPEISEPKRDIKNINTKYLFGSVFNNVADTRRLWENDLMRLKAGLRNDSILLEMSMKLASVFRDRSLRVDFKEPVAISRLETRRSQEVIRN